MSKVSSKQGFKRRQLPLAVLAPSRAIRDQSMQTSFPGFNSIYTLQIQSLVGVQIRLLQHCSGVFYFFIEAPAVVYNDPVKLVLMVSANRSIHIRRLLQT